MGPPPFVRVLSISLARGPSLGELDGGGGAQRSPPRNSTPLPPPPPAVPTEHQSVTADALRATSGSGQGSPPASAPSASLAARGGRDSESELIQHVLRRTAASRRRWNALEDRLDAAAEGGATLASASDGGRVRHVKAALAANLSSTLKLFARKYDTGRTGALTLPVFRAAMREMGFDVSVADARRFWAELGADGDGDVPIARLGYAIRQAGLEVDSALGGEAAMVGAAGRKARELRAHAPASEQRRGRRAADGLAVEPSGGRGAHGAGSGGMAQLRVRRALAANLSRVATLLRAWDNDGVGWVDRARFCDALRLLDLARERGVADALFAQLDTDGSGRLALHDLHRQLRVGDPADDAPTERDAAQHSCRQRQIVELPALARGDLGERQPPADATGALSASELRRFLIASLDERRERAPGGADGGAHSQPSGERAPSSNASSAPLGSPGDGDGVPRGLRDGASADTLTGARGDELEWPALRAELYVVAPPASGRAVQPNRRLVGAGGGVRAELRSVRTAAGARALDSAQRAALSAFAEPRRASTAPAPIGATRKAAYRSRAVVDVPVPRAFDGWAPRAGEDEADYARMWLVPAKSRRPTFGADATAAGLGHFVAYRMRELGAHDGEPANNVDEREWRARAAAASGGAAQYSVLACGSSGSHGGAIFAPPGPAWMLDAARRRVRTAEVRRVSAAHA